jgi:Sulfotransferase family
MTRLSEVALSSQGSRASDNLPRAWPDGCIADGGGTPVAKRLQTNQKRTVVETPDEQAARLEAERPAEEAREAARLEAKLRDKEARREARRGAKRDAKRALASAVFSAEPRRHLGVVEVNQPILLITQVKRSGGVLLSRLFDSHPECFAHPRDLRWDPDGGWPSFAVAPSVSPAQAFGLFQEKWIRQLGDGYSYKFTAVKDRTPSKPPYPFVFDRKLAFEIFADRYLRRAPEAPQRALLDAYLTALFNAWLDYQNLYAGPKRWVTCLQASLIGSPHGVGRFFADYPDGRLVTIVRHPAAWLPRTVGRAEPVDLAAEMAPWQASTRGIIEAVRRYGDQVVVLHFDDLMLRTEATMRALSARIGISYDPVLEKPTFNSLLLTDTAAVFDKWSQSVRADNYFAPHTEAVRQTLERTAVPHYEEARRLALAPDA